MVTPSVDCRLAAACSRLAGARAARDRRPSTPFVVRRSTARDPATSDVGSRRRPTSGAVVASIAAVHLQRRCSGLIRLDHLAARAGSSAAVVCDEVADARSPGSTVMTQHLVDVRHGSPPAPPPASRVDRRRRRASPSAFERAAPCDADSSLPSQWTSKRIGARLGKLVEVLVRIRNHQVRLAAGAASPAAAMRDDRRADRMLGHEVAVHHIHVASGRPPARSRRRSPARRARAKSAAQDRRSELSSLRMQSTSVHERHRSLQLAVAADQRVGRAVVRELGLGRRSRARG